MNEEDIAKAVELELKKESSVVKSKRNKIKKAFLQIPSSRHRENVDRRAYLIGALYYGQGMTEQEVADFLEVKRDFVHHNKVHAVALATDRSYVLNTKDLSNDFEYKLSSHVIFNRSATAKREKIHRTINLHMIFGKHDGYTLKLSKELCENLENYSRICGTRNAESTIRRILTEFFETWEE